MILRTKRWIVRLHILAIALLIGALFVVPVIVRADGDPPPASGPNIDYRQVTITAAQTWPVTPGGVLVVKVTLRDGTIAPPPGWLIVKPIWPRSPADTVSPGAAAATGTLTKFWPTYPNGDAWVVVPVPSDVLVNGAPDKVGLEVDFVALVDRGRSMPVLYYWGHLDHEQPLSVP